MSYPLINREPKGHQARSIYDRRLDSFDTNTQDYSNVNLLAMKEHARTDVDVKLSVWSAPEMTRPLFKDVVKNEFRPASKGEEFGPPWSTHWFKIELRVPDNWSYDVVQLEFDCNCEGMVYSIDGDPMQGLTGGKSWDRRVEFILPKEWLNIVSHTFYIETGMNGMFGNGEGNAAMPPKDDRTFLLESADLVAPNLEAIALLTDFGVIKDCARDLPQNSWESQLALQIANEIMNTFVLGSQESIFKCRKVAQKFLGQEINSAKVYKNPNEHIVTAIGHCHIDTAWLWPFDETRRKTARSWATQLDLLRRYPEHHFACSSAQQFAWLEQDYPTLFKRIKGAVKDGRFEPIGGAWVEMDGNLPSGEAFARQFLYGQRFFEQNFGKRNEIFWLPDTFGFCSQLPQICRLSGIDYGFTARMSKPGDFNQFPNSTFNWVSPDGSQMLMHMAPTNTYDTVGDVRDVVRSVTQHRSLADNRESILPFGNGDGGGGPFALMLEKLRRCRGVSDSIGAIPRVTCGESVLDFYRRLEKDSDEGKNLSTWSGELYLEAFRGTYTSQAKTKLHNRKSEVLLHDVEYLATIASIYTKYKYPKKEIDGMWEKVLLCQFHDVLPGSAIEMVYEDSTKLYDEVYSAGEKIYQDACKALDLRLVDQTDGASALNCLPWERSETIKDTIATGSALAALSKPATSVKIEKKGSAYTLQNEKLRVVVDGGVITSLYDVHAEREIVAKGCKAGLFVILDDDKVADGQAWNTDLYSLDTRRELKPANISQGTCTAAKASIEVAYKISEKSKFSATISLSAQSPFVDFSCTADWYEDHKFLKVEFPVDVQSHRASYETPFGFTERPTHFNTSWDTAKYEVYSHKWADLSENGYGVSVINDSKYGFATHGNLMRLSLLRAPKAPDGHADMGSHAFRFAVMPHAGGLNSEIVRIAKEYNAPMRLVNGHTEHLDAIKVSGSRSVILEAIKRGEGDEDVSYQDGAKRDGRSVVLRLYDALGGRARATITTKFEMKAALKTNILEDEMEKLQVNGGHEVSVELRAFEVYTLRLFLD